MKKQVVKMCFDLIGLLNGLQSLRRDFYFFKGLSDRLRDDKKDLDANTWETAMKIDEKIRAALYCVDLEELAAEIEEVFEDLQEKYMGNEEAS